MNRPIVVLGISIAVLIAAGIGYALWYRVVAAASDRDAQIAAAIQSGSDASARAAAAERALDQLGPAAAALNARFVGVNDIVPFLEKLQEAGSGVGADVEVGSVAENDSPRPHLELAMTVTGSFDAVMRTLGLIENGPYDITTTGASLVAGSSDSGAAIWTATASLSIGTKPGSTGTLQSFSTLPPRTSAHAPVSDTATATPPKPSS
jgi:hypothetical protein